jgi:hypothetical protein
MKKFWKCVGTSLFTLARQWHLWTSSLHVAELSFYHQAFPFPVIGLALENYERNHELENVVHILFKVVQSKLDSKHLGLMSFCE